METDERGTARNIPWWQWGGTCQYLPRKGIRKVPAGVPDSAAWIYGRYRYLHYIDRIKRLCPALLDNHNNYLPILRTSGAHAE